MLTASAKCAVRCESLRATACQATTISMFCSPWIKTLERGEGERRDVALPVEEMSVKPQQEGVAVVDDEERRQEYGGQRTEPGYDLKRGPALRRSLKPVFLEWRRHGMASSGLRRVNWRTSPWGVRDLVVVIIINDNGRSRQRLRNFFEKERREDTSSRGNHEEP